MPFGAAVVMTLTLVACSPNDQGAVTLDAGSKRPMAIVALCDGESVEGVTLSRMERGSRTPIWVIRGHVTGDVFRVVVGEIPPGFREEMPLREGDLGGRLGLITDTHGGVAAQSEQYFRLAELRAGGAR